MQRLSDNEIKISGIEALNRALGSVDAYRFMTILHSEKTDYVEISQRIYNGQSIDNIFDRAKKQWEG